LGKVQRLGHTT